MNTSAGNHTSGADWISPLKLALLAVNGVCFGACVVLLALATVSGALIMLTIGTGLSLGAGLTGAIVAVRKRSEGPESAGGGARGALGPRLAVGDPGPKAMV